MLTVSGTDTTSVSSRRRCFALLSLEIHSQRVAMCRSRTRSRPWSNASWHPVRMLKKQGVEVLNFGVSGYGTAQSYLLLRQHVQSYGPDLVVLAFYNGNDVADNSIVLSTETQKSRPFYLIRDGRLVLDASFQETAAFKNAKYESMLVHAFLNKSYVFQLVKQLSLRRPSCRGIQFLCLR